METSNIEKNLITKIEVQKKNKKRVNIYINEEYLTSCDAEIIYRFNLKNGKEVDVDYIDNIIKEDNYIKCKNDALKIVERSYKTESQIYNKLCEKGYEENVVQTTVKFLKEYNFIDDKRYVNAYIKEKLRKEGINKIKYDLIRKGVSEEIILNKIEEIDKNFQNDRMFEIAKKKYDILIKKENDKFKIYNKLGSFLIRKGYQLDDVKSALNKLTKE